MKIKPVTMQIKCLKHCPNVLYMYLLLILYKNPDRIRDKGNNPRLYSMRGKERDVLQCASHLAPGRAQQMASGSKFSIPFNGMNKIYFLLHRVVMRMKWVKTCKSLRTVIVFIFIINVNHLW